MSPFTNTRIIFEGNEVNSGPPQPDESVFVVPRNATIAQLKEIVARAVDSIMEEDVANENNDNGKTEKVDVPTEVDVPSTRGSTAKKFVTKNVEAANCTIGKGKKKKPLTNKKRKGKAKKAGDVKEANEDAPTNKKAWEFTDDEGTTWQAQRLQVPVHELGDRVVKNWMLSSDSEDE